MDVANVLVSQRAVLLNSYHDSMIYKRELPHLDRYIRRGQRLIDRYYADRQSQSDNCKMAERHIADQTRHAEFIKATSDRAAESLVNAIDSIIRYAAKAAQISGDKGEHLRGGRFIAKGITPLEGFRVIANWQRHQLAWRHAPFNEKNFNHKALRTLGLWRAVDVPVAFLQRLKRPSFFQLERELLDALEYLVCEIGMRHPDKEALAEERQLRIPAPGKVGG